MQIESRLILVLVAAAMLAGSIGDLKDTDDDPPAAFA
jgi:hypothetical protein